MVLGKITDPYGVQGWVRVHPFGDDPLSWGQMPLWWLGIEGRDGAVQWSAHKLLRCRAHSDSIVALFEGVADRSGAEALKGRLVGAPRDALPPAGEDEFYWADLVGLEVVNLRDESLGRVVGLLETGANDVLRVAETAPGDQENKRAKERLLPFVDAVVRQVDQPGGRIVVDWELDW